MADDGDVSSGRAALAAELLYLRALAPWWRAAVTVMVLALCGVLAWLSLDLQRHFADEISGGHQVGRLGNLLASGSSAATAWAGWLAAACFAMAAFRVRHGPPEPPVGRAHVETMTATQMRAGLVREYRAARVALMVVCALALMDSARAVRYVVAAIVGDSVARTSVAATLVEAAGLVAAAVALAVWALSFLQQLRRIGALT